MQYVTGIHALNLMCELDTCGDWHTSAIQWKRPVMRESEGSLWGDYGIELNRKIPDHSGTYAVANHIRALLDLISDGNFSIAQGMNRDFIDNDKYTLEIFEKVWLLNKSPLWDQIDAFIHKEYGRDWRVWRDAKIRNAK